MQTLPPGVARILKEAAGFSNIAVHTSFQQDTPGTLFEEDQGFSPKGCVGFGFSDPHDILKFGTLIGSVLEEDVIVFFKQKSGLRDEGHNMKVLFFPDLAWPD